ncbi:MAG: hypothetical protein HFE93_02720 [Acutalibacter muris]|nr:hypothetical protein [Acutalibacter muris]
MKILASELSSLLYNEGASLAGFGDISALGHDGYTSCMALAVKIPAGVIAGIKDGPTREYFDQYRTLNSRLDSLAKLADKYLSERGHRALAQTTTAVAESAGYRTSRESLVDVEACRKAARALAWGLLGEQITLCGKCIEVCPYTRAYLKKENML